MRPASSSCVGIVLFQEFERYIGHAHMKLRKPMRDERAGNQAEAPAPAPRSTLDPITATVPCSRIRRYRGVGFDHYWWRAGQYGRSACLRIFGESELVSRFKQSGAQQARLPVSELDRAHQILPL